jgi:hypothetical protein
VTNHEFLVSMRLSFWGCCIASQGVVSVQIESGLAFRGRRPAETSGCWSAHCIPLGVTRRVQSLSALSTLACFRPNISSRQARVDLLSPSILNNDFFTL